MGLGSIMDRPIYLTNNRSLRSAGEGAFDVCLADGPAPRLFRRNAAASSVAAAR